MSVPTLVDGTTSRLSFPVFLTETLKVFQKRFGVNLLFSKLDGICKTNFDDVPLCNIMKNAIFISWNLLYCSNARMTPSIIFHGDTSIPNSTEDCISFTFIVSSCTAQVLLQSVFKY